MQVHVYNDTVNSQAAELLITPAAYIIVVHTDPASLQQPQILIVSPSDNTDAHEGRTMMG